jgi:hypothetical protein
MDNGTEEHDNAGFEGEAGRRSGSKGSLNMVSIGSQRQAPNARGSSNSVNGNYNPAYVD